MKDDILAKNLLLDRVCDNCLYHNISWASDLKYEHCVYIGKEHGPGEDTCEKWHVRDIFR